MASKAIQTFEHAIQDATELLDHFDALNTQPPPPQIEVLKRASLVMALAALEAYFEDLLHECVGALCVESRDSERLTSFMKSSLENDLKVFHTPSTDRVKPIFMKYLGYDITEGWSWNHVEPAKARAELNRLAKKRGDIAHRSVRPVPGQPVQHALRGMLCAGTYISSGSWLRQPILLCRKTLTNQTTSRLGRRTRQAAPVFEAL